MCAIRRTIFPRQSVNDGMFRMCGYQVVERELVIRISGLSGPVKKGYTNDIHKKYIYTGFEIHNTTAKSDKTI